MIHQSDRNWSETRRAQLMRCFALFMGRLFGQDSIRLMHNWMQPANFEWFTVNFRCSILLTVYCGFHQRVTALICIWKYPPENGNDTTGSEINFTFTAFAKRCSGNDVCGVLFQFWCELGCVLHCVARGGFGMHQQQHLCICTGREQLFIIIIADDREDDVKCFLCAYAKAFWVLIKAG